MTEERLHKRLANAGIGSRRLIEQWIHAGRIKVDGQVAVVGQKVSFDSEIAVDDRVIAVSQKAPTTTRVILYHKSEGELCSTVAMPGQRTVFDHLPLLHRGKWIMVGRLDLNTSGLLLFTNDGQLAHRLMHPRFNVEREYAVRVLGHVDDAMLHRLKTGVRLDEGIARFKNIVPHGPSKGRSNEWFDVVLTEGRYREVRRLWESQGCVVSRLIRIRYGSVVLPRYLKKGQWEELAKCVF